MSELFDRLQKLDAQNADDIRDFAEKAERPIDDVMREVEETSKADYLSQFNENDRFLNAARIVISKLSQAIQTLSVPYEFVVIGVVPPRKLGKKDDAPLVANVYGIGRAVADERLKTQDGPVGLVKIGFWREDSQKATSFVTGKAYRIFASSKKPIAINGGNVYDIGTTPKTNAGTELPVPSEFKASAALQNIFPITTIKECYTSGSPALSKPGNYNDYRLVHTNFIYARPGKNGRGPSAAAKDRSLSGEDIRNGKSLGIFFDDPGMAAVGATSDGWALGTISGGNDKYPNPSMNCPVWIPNFIVPATVKAAAPSGAGGAAGADDDAVDLSSWNPGGATTPKTG